MHKQGNLVIVNEYDSFYEHMYVFGLLYSKEKLVIFANHLEKASEIMCDYVVNYEPGYECSEEVNETYIEALSEGKNENEASWIAYEGVWHGASGELVSDGVYFICENPGREDLLRWKKND